MSLYKKKTIITRNVVINKYKPLNQIRYEKANIILARTTDALVSDKKTCEALGTCVGKDEIHQKNELIFCKEKFFILQFF